MAPTPPLGPPMAKIRWRRRSGTSGVIVPPGVAPASSGVRTTVSATRSMTRRNSSGWAPASTTSATPHSSNRSLPSANSVGSYTPTTSLPAVLANSTSRGVRNEQMSSIRSTSKDSPNRSSGPIAVTRTRAPP